DDPSQAPAICAAEGSDNSYVAHEYCNKYYQCWAGIPVALLCPAGYLFNPQKDYCDFPANVDCGDKPIVELEDGGNENQNPGNGGNSEEAAPIGDNNDDPS
ncbi:chitin binding peritrophin-A domain-containing protein, partial [Enterobacter hormaechei]|uniref:chitin binding peritrophin-A domain-containing protein n=1 Tax=Enterobacter hormaechei TaxID=158836 RepID=UPI0019819BDD